MKRFLSLPLSAFALVLTGALAAATATTATGTSNAPVAGTQHHATAKHTTAAVNTQASDAG